MISLSDPRLERDGLRHLAVKSPALRARGDVTLFLPPGSDALCDIPLVLLLHGVYSSHWAWTMKGGAHHTARELIEGGLLRPMALAMPSDGLWGDGSGYLKHREADYEKWIVEDVVGSVMEVADCVSERSPLFIAGLSMGGFGALRLGAKHAERFAAISAHSSITQVSQFAQFVEEPLTSYRGESEDDADVLYWVRRNKEQLPPLRFDCGTGDQLIEDNRRLHRDLTALGVPHTYEEFDGAHTWDYWREHLRDTLLFFERVCAPPQ